MKTVRYFGSPCKCGICNKYTIVNLSTVSIKNDDGTKKQIKACVSCASWLKQKGMANNPQNGYLEVVDGIAYRIRSFKRITNNSIVGNKGKTRYLIRKDNSVLKSNDIWEIGKVPDRFLDMFPNTGWWTDRTIYNRASRWFDCESRTCFDRYRCLRYDYRQEFADGPFNIIPKTWVIGSEGCREFIDILRIKNFDNFVNLNDMAYNET